MGPIPDLNHQEQDSGEVGPWESEAPDFDSVSTIPNSASDVNLEAQPPVYRTVQPPKPPKPGVMERFALGEGFKKDSSDRFYRSDGNWIAKPTGERFWELRTARGEVVRHFYARDICLEREPLDIDAEDWRMIEAHPETHSMILVDRNDRPIEVTGSTIRQLKNDGVLMLYQTHFRLVREDGPRSFQILTHQDSS